MNQNDFTRWHHENHRFDALLLKLFLHFSHKFFAIAYSAIIRTKRILNVYIFPLSTFTLAHCWQHFKLEMSKCWNLLISKQLQSKRNDITYAFIYVLIVKEIVRQAAKCYVFELSISFFVKD